MRVKAVDNIKQLGVLGGLFGQIGRAAAADHQHVNFVFHRFRHVGVQHLSGLGCNFEGGGIAAGKYRAQFHIRILRNRCFNAAAEVAVAKNANFDGHIVYSPL